jgi:hypothetical protein
MFDASSVLILIIRIPYVFEVGVALALLPEITYVIAVRVYLMLRWWP